MIHLQLLRSLFFLSALPLHQCAAEVLDDGRSIDNARTSINHDLYDIMLSSGTDKVTRHNYDIYYEPILERYRDDKGFRMLEIGANTGESLVAWAKYFRNPFAIHGIAYVNSERVKSGLAKAVYSTEHKAKVCSINPKTCRAIEVMKGDQSDLNFLRSIVLRGGANYTAPLKLVDTEAWSNCGYDFIVDDGSHVPYHQVLTFMVLFPAVRPGGVYIIEDLETNYWDKGKTASIYGYPLRGVGMARPFNGTVGNAVEKFKQVIDLLQRDTWKSCPGLRRFTVFGEEIDQTIHSITFGNNHLQIFKKTAYQQSRSPPFRHCMVNFQRIADIQNSWMRQNPI